VLVLVAAHPGDPCIARGAVRERQQIAHHFRISGHRGERLRVIVTPFA
jgi:hypothetical protein